MRLKEFNIMVGLKNPNVTPYIEVVQNDYLTSVFNISVVDGGAEYIVEDKAISLHFGLPDGSTVSQHDVPVINNVIKCVLNADVLKRAGRVIGEVKISGHGFVATTSIFEFYVRKSIIG